MKQEEVRALADNELAQVRAWAEEEQRTRAERRRQETIARIKELAGPRGFFIHIDGVRGRPAKTNRRTTITA